MSNPWFRLYSEMVDDAKMRMLSADDRWYFVALLCCKNEGLLDAGDANAILRKKLQIKLGLAPMDLEHCLVRLEEVGLIHSETAQPIAWENRQFLSDSSTARVKAYRQRAKRGRNVTVTAQDTDTEEETDTEKSRRSRQGAGTRLPADWHLPKEWFDWAVRERPELDINAQGEMFRDYWHAQAGAKGRKADWQATWRNWIRNARAERTNGFHAPVNNGAQPAVLGDFHDHPDWQAE